MVLAPNQEDGPVKLALVAAMALSVAGCVSVPPKYQESFSAYCVYGGPLRDWYPPACLHKVKEIAAAKVAARAAAQERLVASYGGPAGYAAHQARQAARERAEDRKIQYSYCREQMPVPVSAFQEHWEHDRCAAYAHSLVPMAEKIIRPDPDSLVGNGPSRNLH